MNLLRLILPMLFTGIFVYLYLYGLNRKDSLVWREITNMAKAAAIVCSVFTFFGAIAVFFGGITA